MLRLFKQATKTQTERSIIETGMSAEAHLRAEQEQKSLIKTQNAVIRSNFENITAQFQAIQLLKKSIIQVEININEYKRQNDALSDSLKSAKSGQTQAQKIAKETQEKYRKTIESLIAKNKASITQIKAGYENQIETLKNQIDAARTTHAENETQYFLLCEEHSALQIQYETISKELESMAADSVGQLCELHALKKSLAQLESENRSLTEQLQEATTQPEIDPIEELYNSIPRERKMSLTSFKDSIQKTVEEHQEKAKEMYASKKSDKQKESKKKKKGFKP